MAVTKLCWWAAVADRCESNCHTQLKLKLKSVGWVWKFSLLLQQSLASSSI